ncbi:MAG TPA: serine hydrolase [Vicinamibacteria bacterium]|nr:serine hydrolase [Vicinamibacteria bacterium]
MNRVSNILMVGIALSLGAACGKSEVESPSETTDPSPRDALIARAAEHELATEYVAPPGDPLAHDASGFAKVMCSAVFITGLDPEFAAENVGYFTAPYEQREHMKDWQVDRENQAVQVKLANGVTRTAKRFGGQGCITLPIGEDTVFFESKEIPTALPDPSSTPWPMGDVLTSDPFPEELDQQKIQAAVDAAFEPAEGLTAAFVVTWKGRLIGERYGDGIGEHTPLESWSMGKSLTATLMGILIQRGVYELHQPAPVPEWQEEGDPRAEIRIADLMHMSSGLRFRAPQDPDFDPALGYPDHLYVYTGSVNSFQWAATRPQQWPPNTIGRYRNSDPVLTNYLIRLGVEKLGEDYHSFPRKALFDKLGIRDMVLETDPHGNFLIQGYELGSGRDWARLGNLYLQDGVWNGERILPEGFADFVSTVAPAWEADGRPIYGGFFWLNRTGEYPIPEDAYYMAGAGNQSTIIIPSHDLVVVRLGHYKGASPGDEGLKKALALLMESVPESH